MANLVFSAAPHGTSPVALVFGASDTTVVSVQVEASVTLGGVSVAAAVFYDNRVTPYLDVRAAAPHNPAVAQSKTNESDWRTTEEKRGGKVCPWTPAVGKTADVDALHKSSVAKNAGKAAPWTLAIQKAQASAAAHQKAVFNVDARAARWQMGDDRRVGATSSMQAGIFKVLPKSTPWQVADSTVRIYDALTGASLRYAGVQSSGMPWQMAGAPFAGRSVLVPVVPPGPDTYVPDTNLVFWDTLFSNHLVFGRSPSSHALVIVPIRKVYMVINNASLRRVDGNIALPVVGMSLSIDTDSWTWRFSASLPGHVLSDIEPDFDGAPVEVEALINGVAYRALIESVGRSREFGKSDLSVQGRGKTALLDSPYALTQSFLNTTDRTAQQLMGDVLTINGVPMGWAVDWGLTDWLVPAGVFSHQGSYISALNAIAGAAGGYIQPHAVSQTLRVLPRYAAAPWDWAGVTPDFDLPSDVTTREGIEWVERARYNRVFVSGQQTGVLGQVTRAGTAGDILAPMVTDALITTASAARQRGLSILANTGRIAEVSLRLPVLAETGVITPGKFVQYTDGGVVRRGVVRSVGVDVGMPEIWQTIGVETHA